jgi:glyoxylase-like metal-dependent hydrolase (beta-lactamase superfamily II)
MVCAKGRFDAIFVRTVDPPTGAGFVIGDDGVAVIDTLATPEAARTLLADIRRRTAKPIAYVVDTHYHLDHVAGNRVFSEAGATVWAHRQVRRWIRSENEHLLGPAIPPELKSLLDGLEPPARIYDNTIDRPLGSLNIQWRNLPGHTGADTVVVIPSARVVFVGDLVWRRMLPTLVDATTRTLVDTLSSLLKQYASYRFVPGHGGLATAADVAEFRDSIVALRAGVAAARAQNKSGDALVGAELPDLKRRFAGWPFIDAVARQNVLDVDAELRGTKRVPSPCRR